MAKCNNCWCEHYDKNRGNCDKCVKNEESNEKTALDVILKRRAVKQMELDDKGKSNGQAR